MNRNKIKRKMKEFESGSSESEDRRKAQRESIIYETNKLINLIRKNEDKDMDIIDNPKPDDYVESDIIQFVE